MIIRSTACIISTPIIADDAHQFTIMQGQALCHLFEASNAADLQAQHVCPCQQSYLCQSNALLKGITAYVQR